MNRAILQGLSMSSEYVKISINKELMETIRQFINDYPEHGFRTLGQFVEDAIRHRAEELGVFKLTPRFRHFNLDDHGVKIEDKKLNLKAIQIYFKPTGILCEYCQTDNCPHIKFALTQPQIKEVIHKKRKEGWKLPEPEE